MLWLLMLLVLWLMVLLWVCGVVGSTVVGGLRWCDWS